MKNYRHILYVTIKGWELQESIRREDPAFDAWEYLADKCGYKNANALRNMCLPRRENNNAKLGFEDSFIIMTETQDYRLFHAMREDLREEKRSIKQINIFSQPVRTIEDSE